MYPTSLGKKIKYTFLAITGVVLVVMHIVFACHEFRPIGQLYCVISALYIAFLMGATRKLKMRHLEQTHPAIIQAMRGLSHKIEMILCSPDNEMLFTTHPGDYHSWHEFLSKTMARFAPDSEQQTLSWLESGRAGQSLVKGIGERWWTVTVTSIEGGCRVVMLDDVSIHLDGYAQLQHRYNQLEAFLDRAPFGFFYTSKTGHIVALNSTMAAWLHQDRSKLLGQNIHHFLKAQTLDHPQMVTVEGDHSKPFRALWVPPSKEAGHTQASLLCRVDWLTTVEDYGALFMEAPLPALLLDNNGAILAANAAFERMLPSHDGMWTLGQACTLIPPKKVDESRDEIVAFECILAGKSTTVVMSNIDGVRRLAQFIDISEQKRLEQQFIQSQKMQAVGQLAGGIAHDFNNLLTAMIGFCDLILQRTLPNDTSYIDVTHIKQNANRAANLVRQLLAFSRQQTLQPTIVNLTDILAELAALLRRLIGASITLHMQHGQELWPIKVDVGQLEQVIINLVVNARDAMSAGGTLTIRTSTFHNTLTQSMGHDRMMPGDYILIEVTDTGSGIAPSDMEHIFEPFFSTKEVGAGTGLGLSTVYGIVKQTGGFIAVESEIGSGTTFKIFLPRHMGTNDPAQEVEAAIRHAPEGDLTGHATVLLVEDEDAVRLFSSRALRDKGYKVLEADSGEAALALVEKGHPFDILVTDVIMPRMDGPTLALHVRDRMPSCPIIFTSGYAEDAFRQNLDRDSHLHFLPKPFTLKELASKIKSVLDEVAQ